MIAHREDFECSSDFNSRHICAEVRWEPVKYNRCSVMMILNSVLLVCITLVSLSLAQAPNKESTASDGPFDVFNERLRLLSSEHVGQATDCATAFAKFGSVEDCARKQFEGGKPFFLGYHGPQNAGFVFAYGLAADAAHNVFAIAYQERGFPPVALNRHMRLMDDNHTRVTDCIKPVRLEATEQGWLTCVTPVNEQASEAAAAAQPLDTTICAVLENPAAFNNRMVRIHAYYWGNMENSTLQDERCQGALWFGFPGGGVPPPVAAYVSNGVVQGSEDSAGRRILPVPVSLVRDSKFDRFEKLVQLNPEPKVPLDGVFATFIGRIDSVSSEVHQFLKQQPSGHWPLGFGHLGGYEAELILQSVADEATVPAPEAPKGHGRFFNDSAKAADFYIDGQFACSVPANPEENNAYCDAEFGYGKHMLSISGPRLPMQSCDVFVAGGTHAETDLSKGERLHCSTVYGEVE